MDTMCTYSETPKVPISREQGLILSFQTLTHSPGIVSSLSESDVSGSDSFRDGRRQMIVNGDAVAYRTRRHRRLSA